MIKSISIFIFLLFCVNLQADIPRLDSATFLYKGEVLFTAFDSGAIIKSDMCYYDYDDNYVGEAEDKLKGILSGNHNVYKVMVKLPFKKFFTRGYEKDEFLYVFDKRLPSDTKFDPAEVELITIEKGNIAGHTYTKGVTVLNSQWIKDYELEKLGFIGTDEMCDSYLFGIKGNVSKARFNAIQNEVKAAFKKAVANEDVATYKSVEEILQDLYKEHIFMAGFCSC